MPFSIPTMYLVSKIRQPHQTALSRASRLSHVWYGRLFSYGMLLSSITLFNLTENHRVGHSRP